MIEEEKSKNSFETQEMDVPQIILKSVEGETVICAVSSKWKQHLVDFLDYVQEDGRQDVYISLPEYDLGLLRDEIARQIEGDEMNVPKYYFSMLSSIFNEFSHIPTNGLYACYDPIIFCRLNDDIRYVRKEVYGDLNGNLRIPELIALRAMEGYAHG